MKWLLVVGLGCVGVAHAQVSPYNGVALVPPDSAGAYRLLIGGHFHGASSSTSGFPAATVLANLDAINATRANALLSTGDLFIQPDRDSARYARSFFSRLTLPLFNAPGNHDLEGSAYAEARRMPQVFSLGNDHIVLFDTERDNSSIKGDQLQVLKDIAALTPQPSRSHVFIVSHRPIWSERDPRYADLFAGNTRAIMDPGYTSDVLPLLRRIAQHSEVYWISGSMAGRAPASIFFQPEETGITYIQCAVRDQLRDALLVADVSSSGVQWSAMSLTGQVMESVTTYSAEWWKEKQGAPEEFHWRRIPYLVKKTVLHPSFGYGALAALLVVAFILFIRRRLRR